MSNTTSLYSTTSSGNVTVPANNNTGLYNTTGVPQTVNNNIAITGNISAAGNITGGNILTDGIVSAAGNIYADNFIGNIVGNIVVPGGNTQVLFNTNGAADASANLTFNSATNILAVSGAVTATGNVSGNYFIGNGSQLTGINANYSNANVTSLLGAFGSNTISTTGNVSAGYFLGDGSQLTNLPIPGIYGNTQVAAFMAAFGSNVVSTTGNVTAGYFLGDGSQLTNLPVQPGTYGNANVAAYLPTFTGNLTANIISATGNVTGAYILGNGSALTAITGANVTGQVASANIANLVNVSNANATSSSTFYVTFTADEGNSKIEIDKGLSNITYIPTSGTLRSANYSASGNVQAVILSASGNVQGGNLRTTGQVSATGNITGNFFLGNGSQLTGLPATYSNANVATFMAAFGSNTISTTGNVTVGYIIGDGSQLTNLPVQPGTYSNANVADYLPVYTGNIAAGNVSATGNVTAAFLKTSGAQGNIVGVNYVSANFYLGDGGLLSNITSSYGNAQVATFLNAFGSNAISTTGNVSAGGVKTDNYYYANGTPISFSGTYGNANVNSLLAAWGSNALSTTGNVTASYVVGNGSLLTNLTGGNVTGQVANALVAGTVYTNAQPNITSVGTLSSLSVTGNVTAGNVNTNAVQATGSGGLALKNSAGTTQASCGAGGGDNFAINVSTNLNGNNAQIDISPTGTGHVHIKPTGTGAVEIAPTNTGSINNMVIGNVTPRAANVTTLGTTGNITAAGILTDGYYYANGTPVSFGGTYGNANVATFLANFGSNTVSTTGNITGGNIIGNIQAPGANTLIPFNNDGVLSGNSNFTYNQATNTLVVNGGQIQAGNFNAGSGQVQALTGNLIDINSTTISASGNITGANIIGNGQFLTNLPGANVTGSVVQANVANTANAVAGANVSGQVANALVAGTVYTNAQPNITSVGTLSALSVTGNIATGGILTDGYFYANGAPFTGGGGGTYGNANVADFMAAFGSNTIVTTGNVSAGNISLTGNITAANLGNVSALNLNGNSSQVLYGNGVFAAVAGGSGSPGGANTQLQFNDSGAFAGNAAMTFDVTSGNIILGNVAINGQRILPNNTGNLDTSLVPSTGNTNPWQLRIGNGYNGSYNTANAVFGQSNGNGATGVGARVVQSDVFNIGNTAGRLSGITSQGYINLTGNVTNNLTRYQGMGSFVAIGGGANANTMLTTIQAPVQAFAGGVTVGNVNANLNIGNTTVSSVTSLGSAINIGAGSGANTGYGCFMNFGYTASTGNIGNVIGYMIQSPTTPANANIVQTSNAVSFYHPTNTNSVGGFNHGNIIRMSTNYHAFRNDDNLAQSRLGMLERFHELNANSATTTGTVNIDKNSGQVQTIYPTGNVTIGTFSNFINAVQKPNGTIVNTVDTVTLIIQQGATPYTVTMPTGNTQIRYAGGINTVGSTANTTTMISITSTYDYTAGANEYLVTISPEFS